MEKLTRQDLFRLRELYDELAELYRERNAIILSALPGAVRYDGDGGSHAEPTDRMADVADRLDKVDEGVVVRLEEMDVLHATVSSQVRAIESDSIRRFASEYWLERRAGQGDALRMSEVCARLHISRQHGYNLRNLAIRAMT